ncbi:hypothetical protein CXG81DRAFT_26590 [Caulochytrium protostelioides]|uniref:Activator of Hsp90 ATPase AHSA1-like N-terminal domain-containing protein n=1 Tax=Caulochytrium protostelioides TaxID=1555241 RepID=A0A4P9X6E2_9FUNG|nr:hypothetical protein CXG81DRAFT_26590 [Caulochytrium protostelioides]|eukprot:RKP00722.1 hypothetical protein CXG81DRAFT_26590 [Caulochytrium protostelioides]
MVVNANNWHWVEKNCLPWAQDWFKTELPKAAQRVTPEHTVRLTEITQVTGDVDLNQRKGKVITIYDVAIHATWEAFEASQADVVLKGTLALPEFMHDTDLDARSSDLACEIATTTTPDAMKPEVVAQLRDLVRTQLLPDIKARLAQFGPALLQAHGKDIQVAVDAARSGGTASSYKPAPPGGNAASSAEADAAAKAAAATVKGSVTTVTQDIEFVCSADDLFAVLTDPQRAQGWTRGQASLGTQPGTPLRLFDGNITGTVVSAQSPQLGNAAQASGTEASAAEAHALAWDFRLSSWPAAHVSRVTFAFSEAGSGHGQRGTRLQVTQTGVPVGETETVRRNWEQFFWRPIKTIYGFGSVF